MMEDRPYQTKAVKVLPHLWQHHQRVLMVAPTAAGKSQIAKRIVELVIRNGRRVRVCAHRRLLVQQLAERMMSLNIPYAIEMANVSPSLPWFQDSPDAKLYIASKDTLLSRHGGGRWGSLPDVDLDILDECHRVEEKMFGILAENSPARFRLGLTATPVRPDGSGLGTQHWDTLYQVATVKELTDGGFLVPLRVYSPPQLGLRRAGGDRATGVSGDPVAEWFKHAEGSRTIGFLRSVAEAREVADRFRDAGVPSAMLSADSSNEERDRVLGELKAGRVLYLANVNLFVEGADMPELGCVQLLRKFSSLQSYIQAVGRVLRRRFDLHGPGRHKEYGILLDHSGCWAEHRYPEWCPEWRLNESAREFKDRIAKEKELAPACQCRGCGGLFAGLPACPYCGTPVPQSKRRAKPKLEREKLAPVECAVGAFTKTVEQRGWERCVAVARARNMTVKAANCMFRNEFGVWPSQIAVTPRFSWDDKDVKVSDLYLAMRTGTRK